MHANTLRSAVGISILLIVLFGYKAQGDAIPPDHPINKAPNIFRSAKAGPEVTRHHAIEWSFRLSKEKFELGEPIWGTLTVKNQSQEDVSVTLSPPMNGAKVSTISVWYIPIKEGIGKSLPDDEKTTWTELTKVNKGVYENRNLQYQGKPIVLAPGKSYSTPILLNVAQPIGVHKAGLVQWFSGIGFEHPGKYKVYLKYLNLEKIMPFEYRSSDKGRKIPAVKAGAALVLPYQPVVMGSIEVEVTGSNNEARAEWLIHLKHWNGLYRQADDGLMSIQPLAPNRETINGWVRKGMANDLAMSFELTWLRQATSVAHGENNKNAIKRYLVEIESMIPRAEEGPLKNAITFTQCELLLLLGEKQKAIELAEKLGTPDAIVLLEELRTPPLDK